MSPRPLREQGPWGSRRARPGPCVPAGLPAEPAQRPRAPQEPGRAPVSFLPCPGVLRPPPQQPPPRRHPGEVGWMPRRFSRAKGKRRGRGEPSCTPSPARLPQAPAPTHLAAGVPEGLRVVVAGIHSVGGGVDARELVLVEAQVLSRLLLQDLLGLGLAEGRHLPAGRHCRVRRAASGHRVSRPPRAPIPPPPRGPSPSISTSWMPTDLVYLTRSERARDSFTVFFCRVALREGWGQDLGRTPPCSGSGERPSGVHYAPVFQASGHAADVLRGDTGGGGR